MLNIISLRETDVHSFRSILKIFIAVFNSEIKVGVFSKENVIFQNHVWIKRNSCLFRKITELYSQIMTRN